MLKIHPPVTPNTLGMPSWDGDALRLFTQIKHGITHTHDMYGYHCYLVPYKLIMDKIQGGGEC